MPEIILKIAGIVIGSPVYFAGPNGALCAALDRVFYTGIGTGAFADNPAAAVISCRRWWRKYSL